MTGFHRTRRLGCGWNFAGRRSLGRDGSAFDARIVSAQGGVCVKSGRAATRFARRRTDGRAAHRAETSVGRSLCAARKVQNIERGFPTIAAAELRISASNPYRESVSPQPTGSLKRTLRILPVVSTGRVAISARARVHPTGVNLCYENHRLRDALDLHGGAIGQHFSDALHDFRGVVTHSDNGIGAMLRGVHEHQFVGVFASFLA